MRSKPNQHTPGYRLSFEDLEMRALLCATGPHDFEITAPAQGETVYTSTPTVEWSMSDGAIAYSVDFRLGGPAEPAVWSDAVNSVPPLAIFPDPLPDGTYYLDITAPNSNVPGNLVDACNNLLEFTIDAENAAAVEHTVFITNDVFNVDPLAEPNPTSDSFGGFSSADFQVTKAAAFGGMIPNWDANQRIWKALISTETDYARFRQDIHGPVFNMAGELLASNVVDFWDGTLDNPIRFDNFGLEVSPNTQFWSGSDGLGQDSDNCGDWQQTGSFISRMGDSHETLNWFSGSTNLCSVPRPLLGISPPQRAWTIDCDLNDDSDCDVEDLNGLLRESDFTTSQPQGNSNWAFDLNGDAFVDNADLDYWLATAATFNGLASPYKRGDANLDGVVDGSDFNIWNANKFTRSDRWDDGDFNGDGSVDGSDFNIWNANKFTSSDDALSLTADPSVDPVAIVAPSLASLQVPPPPQEVEVESEHRKRAQQRTILDLVFAAEASDDTSREQSAMNCSSPSTGKLLKRC